MEDKALIRKISQEDNQAMAKIIRSSLESFGLDKPGTAYFDKSLRDLYSHYASKSGAGYFVIDLEGRVLGGGGYSPYQGSPLVAELEKLYIIPSYQGRGYASLLYQAIEEGASKDGYKKIYIETSKVLAKANDIYKGWGFIRLKGPLAQGGHFSMDRFYIKDINLEREDT